MLAVLRGDMQSPAEQLLAPGTVHLRKHKLNKMRSSEPTVNNICLADLLFPPSLASAQPSPHLQLSSSVSSSWLPHRLLPPWNNLPLLAGRSHSPEQVSSAIGRI